MDTMKIRMYAKSEATINNIMEAARTLFSEKNYADVTLAEISAHAEVSKGALYHHFSSKEDLYLRMMHHFLGQVQAITQNEVENSIGSCRERLRQSVLSFLKLPAELHSVVRLVRRDINIFTDPMRNELIRAYQTAVPEQVQTIITDGIAAGEVQDVDARLLSWELVAIVEVALRPYSRLILGDPEHMADYVVGLFLDGVAVNQSGKTSWHAG